MPHGERVTARCRELGRYKLQGDPLLQCRNGAWNGKPPSCIPTTAISNYTGAYITLIIIMFQLALPLSGHVTNPHILPLPHFLLLLLSDKPPAFVPCIHAFSTSSGVFSLSRTFSRSWIILRQNRNKFNTLYIHLGRVAAVHQS